MILIFFYVSIKNIQIKFIRKWGCSNFKLLSLLFYLEVLLTLTHTMLFPHFSERPSLFNISNSKGASLQTVLEIEKGHATLENAISVQENKKGDFILNYC